jgi:galactose-1-phosphate uridylyltransferase
MEQHITQETLKTLIQAENIDALSIQQIENFFLDEEVIRDYIPDGIYQVDPRTGDRIVYNSSRAKRPHDNIPQDITKTEYLQKKDCVICQGKTTGILDITELSQGYTFINKNLYPIFYPLQHLRPDPNHPYKQQDTDGFPSYGFHFLQWTSSYHNRDWHNMPLADREIVMERLAALENKLLTSPFTNSQPSSNQTKTAPVQGYVSVIKNYGYLVGGSLIHGHQQIAFSNVMPRRVIDHIEFEKFRSEKFSSYLLENNPAQLIIKDYGSAVLLVPYFMRRPYDMFLVIKDPSKQYLYQLDKDEISAASQGWHDGILLMLLIMHHIQREPAYNVITHNGEGAGIYFEFLPYTQEIGGMEHLGLYLCQANPFSAAKQLKKLLNEQKSNS